MVWGQFYDAYEAKPSEISKNSKSGFNNLEIFIRLELREPQIKLMNRT